MENRISEVQSAIEQVDFLMYCMKNSMEMLTALNESPRCGMKETVEGSMMTMSHLLQEAQGSVKAAIDLLCEARRVEDPKGGAA